MRGALLRGASHEPKDVFSRALFLNAPEYVGPMRGALVRGAVVSEGVLHVGVMGVALPRALFSHARGAFAAQAGTHESTPQLSAADTMSSALTLCTLLRYTA